MGIQSSLGPAAAGGMGLPGRSAAVGLPHPRGAQAGREGSALAGNAVGCAGDSSMAGLWCGVSHGVLQPLRRVVTGLADGTTVLRGEIISVAFPGVLRQWGKG